MNRIDNRKDKLAIFYGMFKEFLNEIFLFGSHFDRLISIEYISASVPIVDAHKSTIYCPEIRQ